MSLSLRPVESRPLYGWALRVGEHHGNGWDDLVEAGVDDWIVWQGDIRVMTDSAFRNRFKIEAGPVGFPAFPMPPVPLEGNLYA